jgi:hypothetical protein
VAIVAALAGAAIALAAVFALGAGGGTGAPSTKTAAPATVAHGNGFALAVPSGWHALTAAERARVPGRPVAVLQRRDGNGLVVVRRTTAPKHQTLTAVSKRLTAGFKKRFADFSFVSARLQRLRGGSAFLYTFIRTKNGTAQSVALTAVRGSSFTLDSAAAVGDRRAAAEVAAIVRSFGP